MEIVVGKTAGFCFGIENAVTKAEKELEQSQNVYCLGELAHNKEVIETLIKKGLTIIEDINDAKGKLIIRAHGVTKKTYEIAKEKNIELIDLTCPKVLKIHEIAEEYAKKGYYIFLVGQANHAEIIGTVSYCGKYFSVIENIEDVESKIEDFEKTDKKDVLMISQTTFSIEKFDMIIDKLEKKMSGKNFKIVNTICNATKERQDETEKIAEEVDLMIIIGGKHSSNTNKLYEISKKYCENVFLIETKEELEINAIKNFEKIGIMAGASTPQKSIDEVVAILKEM